uniref:Uncharacterized protein n=1 Tax=Anguilla anguilla TaxID=7936 RepID=A0A0E9RUX3_ANGAN
MQGEYSGWGINHIQIKCLVPISKLLFI